MKKNLLFSVLAAFALLAGGLGAHALSRSGQEAAISASRSADEMKATPENGGKTATVPNPNTPGYQSFIFSIDEFEDNITTIQPPKITSKIAVKYAGKTIDYNSLVAVPDEQLEEGDNPYGWSVSANDDYSGIIVKVHNLVFTAPGTLEIDLQEGAFDTYDDELSPEYHYTYTFGATDIPAPETKISVKAFRPEAGATVKSLSKVNLFFDLSTLGENMVLCDPSEAKQITLTKTGSEEAIHASDVYFDDMAWLEETMPYAVTFPEVTEEGEYTMTVPAGFFWAATDTEEGEKPADAVVNKEISVKYTVDPNEKSGMQVYKVLSPALSPETVPSVDEVIIDFTKIDGQIMFADEPEVNITKDGSAIDGVTCYLTWNWNNGNMHTASITFEKDEDPYVLAANGTYELTIGAGSITHGDDSCDEIKISFTVKAEAKEYTWTATPANNGHIDLPSGDGFKMFTFAIKGAKEVSYDEWEDPNHDITAGDVSRGLQITYNGKGVSRVANVAAVGDENIGYSLRDNLDEPEIVIGISNAVFTKGGVLNIKIDEGYFTADGTQPTPAINYSCTVGEIVEVKDYEVKVSPAMDIDTEYLIDYFNDGFKIEFTNAETVEPNMVKDRDDNNNPIMVLANPPHLAIGDAVYYGDVKVEEVKDAEHPTFVVTFPDMSYLEEAIELGGSINFSVDEGTFTVDGEYDSPAISQTWKLKRTKPVVTDYTFGPLGDAVNEGYGIFLQIAFDWDEYIVLDQSKVVVKFNDEPVSGYSLTVLNGDNRCINLEFTSGIFRDKETTGTITVEIPEGAITLSGVKLGAITHTWNIVLPKTFTYKVAGFSNKYTAGPTYDWKENADLTTDLPTVNDLSEITLAIPEAESVQIWNPSYINLRSRDYFSYSAKKPDEAKVVEDAEVPTVKFTFPAPTVEDIVYELMLNLGALYIDDAYQSPNLEFAVLYSKTSGIVDVMAVPAEGYTVVSMDGRVVLTNGTAEQVNALAKGIYIINGKKVAVK